MVLVLVDVVGEAIGLVVLMFWLDLLAELLSKLLADEFATSVGDEGVDIVIGSELMLFELLGPAIGKVLLLVGAINGGLVGVIVGSCCCGLSDFGALLLLLLFVVVDVVG